MDERDDIRHVCVYPPFTGDSGMAFRLGFNGVTRISRVMRPGPMAMIPYIEVWQDDHLCAEIAQHQCAYIEFKYIRHKS